MLNLTPATIISRIITLTIAFSVHEFSHAWTADRFGDDTPRYNGRLTLNPAVHLDLMGTLMLLFVGFGWAKPVPVNPYTLRRRSPSAMMWVSLAGPLSNLLLAVIAAIPLRLGLVPYSASSGRLFPTPSGFLLEFIFVNLALALFNLIPLAPLDGDKVAEFLFPPPFARFLERIRPYSPLILLALLFLLPYLGIDIVGWVIRPVITAIARLLLGV
ncbi:MAG: site-2 protease family protein [Anaerolineae bacterium]|nr:site-2 protease family protein [Anaerolineae bacterium]